MHGFIDEAQPAFVCALDRVPLHSSNTWKYRPNWVILCLTEKAEHLCWALWNALIVNIVCVVTSKVCTMHWLVVECIHIEAQRLISRSGNWIFRCKPTKLTSTVKKVNQVLVVSLWLSLSQPSYPRRRRTFSGSNVFLSKRMFLWCTGRVYPAFLSSGDYQYLVIVVKCWDRRRHRIPSSRLLIIY